MHDVSVTIEALDDKAETLPLSRQQAFCSHTKLRRDYLNSHTFAVCSRKSRNTRCGQAWMASQARFQVPQRNTSPLVNS